MKSYENWKGWKLRGDLIAYTVHAGFSCISSAVSRDRFFSARWNAVNVASYSLYLQRYRPKTLASDLDPTDLWVLGRGTEGSFRHWEILNLTLLSMTWRFEAERLMSPHTNFQGLSLSSLFSVEEGVSSSPWVLSGTKMLLCFFSH